jgi:hypothetical protein
MAESVKVTPIIQAIDQVIGDTQKSATSPNDPELVAALDRLRQMRDRLASECTSGNDVMPAAALRTL